MIDGSVHKLALGHNVLGNPESFSELVRWASDRFDVPLSDAPSWKVLRMDWAYLFDLGTSQAVAAFLRGMRGVEYPRRSVNTHGIESLYCSGSTTSVRMYHKGPEFRKNGKPQAGAMGPAVWEWLCQQASSLLRVEVRIKAKKLAVARPLENGMR